MPSAVVRSDLAEITRTNLLESVRLKLAALILTGTETDRVMCWFTSLFCTEWKIHHECSISEVSNTIYTEKNVEKLCLWINNTHII